MAKILSICISSEKGTAKQPVEEVILRADHGIEGDAHAGKWHRQVSLLAEESHALMREKGAKVVHGSFGENIVTEGLDLLDIPVGTIIRLGETVRSKMTQHGKECHGRCAIYDSVGDCIMPREGVFVEIIEGGTLRVGDKIVVEEK